MSTGSSSRAGPTDDDSITRVLEAAPPPVARLLRTYLTEPPLEVDELRETVRTYLAKLEHLDAEMEFLDLTLARQIAYRCEALLDGIDPRADEAARRLVHAAVRYFVEDDDVEGDTTSPIGFDDDAEVVELVARELGREDVLITEPGGER